MKINDYLKGIIFFEFHFIMTSPYNELLALPHKTNQATKRVHTKRVLDNITFIFIQVRLFSSELPAGYGSLPNAILANGSRDEESYLPGSSPIESKRLRFGLPGVLGVVL